VPRGNQLRYRSERAHAGDYFDVADSTLGVRTMYQPPYLLHRLAKQGDLQPFLDAAEHYGDGLREALDVISMRVVHPN
jgi:hypothetical protein